MSWIDLWLHVKLTLPGHDHVSTRISEAQAMQKKIRDMELELARMKANYPAGKVNFYQCVEV